VSTAEAVFLKLEDFHIVSPSGDILYVATLRSCIPTWRILPPECNFLCFVGLDNLLCMQISCCKTFHLTWARKTAGLLTIFILVHYASTVLKSSGITLRIQSYFYGGKC
jgi:hypothetical protein